MTQAAVREARSSLRTAERGLGAVGRAGSWPTGRSATRARRAPAQERSGEAAARERRHRAPSGVPSAVRKKGRRAPM